MADDTISEPLPGELPAAIDRVETRTQDLTRSANAFARSMTAAFAQSVTGARGFDDTLKSLGLRLSNLALQAAFRPRANLVTNGFGALFGAGFGMPQATDLRAAMGAVKPFASGGIIGTPSYFPLTSGGVGLAGEAGPEAIMPLARGPDGRLGVAAGGAWGARITVNITTPDAESFRRSEVFVTGQIARAVARGQRGL
jgi:phage-related minor tail protein